MYKNRLNKFLPRDVVITSFARTPIGSFLGSLGQLTAPKLGGIAISNALKRSCIEGDEVNEVCVGQVLTAGCGQAPARQAALHAKIPTSVDVYSVNKVCSSGLKAVCLSAQALALNHDFKIAVACGMESMTNTPYLCNKVRGSGLRYGNGELIDGILFDGLTDPYNNIHMGKCAEKTVRDYCIGRIDQDTYAVESYKRSSDVWKGGILEKEVVPIQIANPNKKLSTDPQQITVDHDEEFTKIKLDKVASLRSVFDKDGTITAFNASKLSDGAAAVVLMTKEHATNLQVKQIARIVSFADAAVEPIDFSTAPAVAIKKALKYAGLSNVDFYEINEAFSCVALVNMQILDLDSSRVNVHGGAVSLGHPLGMSGCRILISLMNVLMTNNAPLGCAAICNGGGGASAIIIEMI